MSLADYDGQGKDGRVSMICGGPFRAVRGIQRYSLPCSYSSSSSAKRTSTVNFCAKNAADEMEGKSQQQPIRDVMSDSFGDAYATRCDEEGFGGIYGGNQDLPEENEATTPAGKYHESDKTHGSEVKQKEKARHQPEVAKSE